MHISTTICALLGLSLTRDSVTAFSFPQQNIRSSFGKHPTSLFGVKDGDESVFELADDMTELAFVIYPYTDLRGLVKDGKIDAPELLKLPITCADIAEAVEKNKEVILSSLDKESLQSFDTFERIAKRQADAGPRKSARIIAYDDKFKEKSLVYMVIVNDAKKRITVCFRGTNTPKDMIVDVSAWLQETPNRMLNRERVNQPKTIRIHDGFHDYLFDDISDEYKSEVEGEGVLFEEDRSKFEVILKKYVIPALEKNKGYELFVAGHSLGAALATLFAMRASTYKSESIPKPVTCVAVASPFVGALDYRKSVKAAEKMGLLRILRISGQGDIINCLPFVSVSLRKNMKNAFSKGPLQRFKHVGLNLKLPLEKDMGTKKYKLMYPKPGNKDERSKEASLLTNLDLPQNLLPNHLNYPDKVEALRNDKYLTSVTLAELYADKDIVEFD